MLSAPFVRTSLAPAVSALQVLKFGTLSFRLFESVPVMILSVINSRPPTSSRPSNPLSASFLAPQFRPWLHDHCARLHIIFTYLRTYLLTYLLTSLTSHTASTSVLADISHFDEYVATATKSVHRLQIRPIGDTLYYSPKLHPGPCSSVGMR